MNIENPIYVSLHQFNNEQNKTNIIKYLNRNILKTENLIFVFTSLVLDRIKYGNT
jgi:hypothetical protein